MSVSREEPEHPRGPIHDALHVYFKEHEDEFDFEADAVDALAAYLNAVPGVAAALRLATAVEAAHVERCQVTINPGSHPDGDDPCYTYADQLLARLRSVLSEPTP